MTALKPDLKSDPTTPHVCFEGVSKSYDGKTLVVHSLDLEVARGEFLTLLGPSGSGKTTILMLLAGFEVPSAGVIRVAGKPVQDLPPRKRGIGMVFQNYALFPHMTVRENLEFPLEARSVAAQAREERVARAMDLVRLSGLAGRRPAQLSGGQQQRVAIARALVFEPELVLMDEPLGALDRSLREEMQYEIRSIQRRLGVTMVYVTHDQREAMVMSDRIAVLRGGRIEQIAGPEGLYEEPERVFVANFIGENNRLDAEVTSVEEHLCEVVAGGETIRAIRVADCEVGDTVTLSMRPERVAVNPRDGLYSNETDAIVEDVVFLGGQLRVRMTACGSDQIVAKIPNMLGHGGLLVGDTVRIGWAVADCRALAAEPAHS